MAEFMQALSQMMIEMQPIMLMGLLFPLLCTLAIALGTRLFSFLLWVRQTVEKQGKRKKKKDEYDAYYDARLAQPEQDTEIAYYEDEAVSHLTHK